MTQSLTYDPVRTIQDTVRHPHRTLAGELVRWSAYAFRLDWKYTPEHCRILARWYELRDDAVPEDPNDPETWGRSFRHESGTLRCLKGWGDPAMASVCTLEFVGPCRLVGFRADGSPIGGPPAESWVQVFATAALQNVNTMSAFSTIFSQAAIDRYAIKLGQEVCYASQTDTDGRQCRLEAKPGTGFWPQSGTPAWTPDPYPDPSGTASPRTFRNRPPCGARSAGSATCSPAWTPRADWPWSSSERSRS
ncbi:hypothetical protein [Streptomyces goshikiensis]|uniref:hypothetical protein n=1 Tax=Streptomyces goshikiensis TaxID=1942 RepID=UPI0036581561